MNYKIDDSDNVFSPSTDKLIGSVCYKPQGHWTAYLTAPTGDDVVGQHPTKQAAAEAVYNAHCIEHFGVPNKAGAMSESQIKSIESYCLARAKAEHPDLPSDAAAIASLPSEDDSRMWIDIVSNEFYEQTAEEYRKQYPGDEPMGEPVFDQYFLVSGGLLQEKCPEIFDKYSGT